MKHIPIQPNQFSNSRILVIGDIMLDCYLWGKVERISPEAPVPILQTKERTFMLGGAGNVAMNLVGLGCQTDIVALCGQDSAGDRIKKMLARKNINGDLIISDQRRKTTTKTRIMALKQQLLRIDEEEISSLFSDEVERLLRQIEMHIDNYQAVILSDYGKGIFQTQNLTESIISVCNRSKVKVLVDPKGKDWHRYKQATCITPNCAELGLICDNINDLAESVDIENEKELIEISNKIRSKFGLEWLLVTRGPKGMCLTGKTKSPLLVPTQARQVYDVSGAGDTVISVLAAGISIGLSFENAAKLANAAAGIVVGKVGTQPVTFNELNESFQIPFNNTRQ